MGFRNGSYATVWKVNPRTSTITTVQLSISRKDKQTDEFVVDFSGFVDFIGTAAATKAMKLKEKDRIRLGNTDVATKYIPEKNITYTNFKVFSFDSPEEIEAVKNVPSASNNGALFPGDCQPEVDSGNENDEWTPF